MKILPRNAARFTTPVQHRDEDKGIETKSIEENKLTSGEATETLETKEKMLKEINEGVSQMKGKN